MSDRNFTFPISTLIRDSKRLGGALVDPVIGPPVLRRLATNYLKSLTDQITLVERGGSSQSTAIGALGGLTEEQTLAYTEMERLLSGARRSATLFLPKGDPRLHAEFKVGTEDEAQDLGSEIERARIVATACRTYATSLAQHGWLAEDTDALDAAIQTLEGADEVQETAKGKKKGITTARTLAANALYKMCLTVQNAARLAYPSTKIGQVDGIVEARARFLLDEFPPHRGASAGENPDPHGPTPPPTPPANP